MKLTKRQQEFINMLKENSDGGPDNWVECFYPDEWKVAKNLEAKGLIVVVDTLENAKKHKRFEVQLRHQETVSVKLDPATTDNYIFRNDQKIFAKVDSNNNVVILDLSMAKDISTDPKAEPVVRGIAALILHAYELGMEHSLVKE